MPNAELALVPASDRSLLVRTRDVARLLRVLELRPPRGVVNLHPAYSSILVVFEPLLCDHATLGHDLRELFEQSAHDAEAEPRKFEIPVRYGGDAGPDLHHVASAHNLTAGQVIELHCGATYRVAFLGFLPGFAYLEGLPPELNTPRLPAPRPSVPAGSVGIGGAQTAVYPFTTPGGWRIIGRTSVRMFRPDAGDPSLLRTGDLVRFVPCA